LAENDKTSLIARFKRAIRGWVGEPGSGWMIKSIIEDLRAVAQKCTTTARDCSHGELSRILQELGVDLTTIALDIEEKFDQ